ncbi:flagellar assembly protein H [Nostoc sp. RF31YmG]|nr:flagellar assembly protein H [Nostoc sp. RF31YmG]
MKTDSIFYQLFQSFPSIFFELIGEAATVCNEYTFTSVEIKQTNFRIDGLFLPAIDYPDQPIYFVEVQFQPDPRFYSRLFGEIFLYLRQYPQPNDWRAVVVYPQRSLDPGVPMQYRDLILSQQVQHIYLDELGEVADLSLGVGVVKLVVSQEKAVAEARLLINKARQEIVDEAVKKQVIELIETIVWYKLPQMTRQEIAEMFGLSELKQTRAYQEVREEAIKDIKEEIKEEVLLETVPRWLALGLTLFCHFPE